MRNRSHMSNDKCPYTLTDEGDGFHIRNKDVDLKVFRPQSRDEAFEFYGFLVYAWNEGRSSK